MTARLRALAQVVLATLFASGALWLWTTDDGQDIDRWLLRRFFEFRGPQTPPLDVVLVAIDDESIAAIGADTMNSRLIGAFARGLERIVRASPRAVIIDARINSAGSCSKSPEADDLIEKSLRDGPTTIWSGELPNDRTSVAISTPAVTTVLPSDERFRKAAKMELRMWSSVSRGVVERISLGTTKSATMYEQIPLARPLSELAGISLERPGLRDLINYYGPPGTITRVPLHRLIDGSEAAISAALANKIVLYGYQSVARDRGLMDKDEFMTSASTRPMFGVEIHANIVGNLIDRSWIRRMSLVTELNVIFLSVLLTVLIGFALSPALAFPLLLLMNLAVLSTAYFCFVHLRYWIPGVGLLPIASSIALYLGLLSQFCILKHNAWSRAAGE